MKAFRLYTTSGCPVCKQATEFINSNKLPCEFIEVGFDPVVQKGLAALFNDKPIQLPLLICFFSQELLVGFTEADYTRVMDSYNIAIKGE